jgi:hypothetical protein
MELLIATAVIALLVYGLQHNTHPNPHLAGSTDITDRDQDRLTTDLKSHQ